MKCVYVGLVALLFAGTASAHGENPAAGAPGDPKQVDRTIAISTEDLRFDPSDVLVRNGETIKFVITNHGKLPHEFMIGDEAAQEAHEKEMQSMKDMVHADPNAVSIKPGETKTLVWKFGGAGTLEFGCHVPGHYAAGMVGTIRVVPPHPSH